ncbi:Crp/Fnr family transcriptional regulator [Phreatobacter sp. HK31-P]
MSQSAAVVTASAPELTQNALFRLLRPEALAFVAREIEVRPVEAGDCIYEDNESVTDAVFPLSGMISFMARMTDGRTIEKGNVGPEGFVGIATMMERDVMRGRCVVQIGGHAAWLPASVFDEAIERFICVRRMLLRYGKARIEQLHELVVCTSLHSADHRVARWILDASDKAGSPTFELKQEVLAELLGLRRATVSGACHHLLGEGIIRYSRGRLEIVDRARMEAAACECYAHIRSRFAYRPLPLR